MRKWRQYRGRWLWLTWHQVAAHRWDLTAWLNIGGKKPLAHLPLWRRRLFHLPSIRYRLWPRPDGIDAFAKEEK